MRPAEHRRQSDEIDAILRHRFVPARTVEDMLIVARPRDGAPVVMASTAALVWRMLDDWVTPGQIARSLTELFPAVADHERLAALRETLEMLQDEDLLEQG